MIKSATKINTIGFTSWKLNELSVCFSMTIQKKNEAAMKGMGVEKVCKAITASYIFG